MIKCSAYVRLMRLNRPVGIILLLWPTLWALWLANHGMPPLKLLVVFVAGVVITRSAGCVINDYADQKFDGHVERTQLRPLATGELSKLAALITLSVLGLLALVLVVCLNPLAIFLSVVAALLALIYPFMKRFTYFPQLVLGLAFAMPVPIAFAASVNSLPPICWLLFVIAVLWPLMYDTAYAINDQIDDAKLGLKSTALRFGAKTPLFIAILQGMLLILWAWLGGLLSFHCFFWLSLGLTALGFIYQQRLLHQNQAFAAFLNNQWIGGILWLGLVLGGF